MCWRVGFGVLFGLGKWNIEGIRGVGVAGWQRWWWQLQGLR